MTWLRILTSPRTICILLVAAILATAGWQWYQDPFRQFSDGMSAYRAGDRDGIERAASQLANEPGFELQHAFFVGSLLLRDGQPEAALDQLLPARFHPDVSVDASVLAGEAAYQLGAAGNSKLFWENALFQDPECVAAHQWLGVLYFDLGAMENALLHLQAVSRLAPDDPRPDRLMGLINHDYERPEEAIRHYLETIKRDPDQPDIARVWLELAECQIKLREFDAALVSLGNTEDSDQKKTLVARCQLNLGNIDEARQLAESVMANDQSDVEALKLNAEIALLDGKVNAAADFLKSAAELHPYNHGVRSQLAQVLARQGLTEEAQAQTLAAEELQQRWLRFSDLQVDAINQPANAAIRHEIAQLAESLGMPELAETWYKAAVAINPNFQPTGNPE